MWMKDLFKTNKPVIGMLHLLGMPTDPKYDPEGGMRKVIERARADLKALQDGGIDAIIVCNEFSIPYVTNVRPVTIASMARIIGELKSEIRVPLGVDTAIDPYSVFDLAVAVDADFVRETFHGAYTGDYGINNNQLGEVMRHRHEVGADHIRTLATLVPEGMKQVSEREIEDVARSFTFAGQPDALLVYGLTAGRGVDSSLIKRAKSVVDTPVFASNGVNDRTIVDTLTIADGCVVGTYFKYDGQFYNGVDVERVKKLMGLAKEYRGDE